ncbi:MAG: hypothetical protein J6M07_05545 [Ruminococcus sp.]|nr:hypothetical protein [Ruminococcus sp.]
MADVERTEDLEDDDFTETVAIENGELYIPADWRFAKARADFIKEYIPEMYNAFMSDGYIVEHLNNMEEWGQMILREVEKNVIKSDEFQKEDTFYKRFTMVNTAVFTAECWFMRDVVLAFPMETEEDDAEEENAEEEEEQDEFAEEIFDEFLNDFENGLFS